MDAPLPVEPLRVRRVPMLLAAGCFAAGIALARGRWHSAEALVSTALLLLLLTGAAAWRAPRVAWLPVLALWCTVGCWCAQMQPAVAQQSELLRYADGLRRTVRGTVVQVRPLSQPDDPRRGPNPDEAHPPAEPWLAEPGAWEPETASPRASVDLKVAAVEDVTPDVATMQPVSGGVRLTLGGDVPALHCGDRIEVPVRLRQPDTFRDPGAPPLAGQLLQEGVGALGSAGTGTRPAHLLVTGREPPGWGCRLRAAQAWASARLTSLPGSAAEQRLPASLRLRPDDTAMLAAMLFGDRTRLSRTLRTGFERTGTFHLFVVSGLHVVLLAGGLLWLLRRMRLPYGVAVLLSLGMTTGYALLTGWGPPVQRALGMTALYMLARLLARTAGALNALGVAAVAVLALDPHSLFTASFQMTFLVIFAIAGLAAPLEQRSVGRVRGALRDMDSLRLDAWLSPAQAQWRVRLRMWGELLRFLLAPDATAATRSKGWQNRLAGWPARVAAALPASLVRGCCAVAAAALTGLVAECCLVLPMAVYFHRATLLALPVNLLCLPLIGLLLSGAVLTFALSLYSARVAVLPALLTAGLLHAVRAVVAHAGAWAAADLRVPSPATAVLVVAGVALIAALGMLRASLRWTLPAGVALLALLPLLALAPEPPLLHPAALEVTALDVGQGDSLLIVSPEGRTLLVDGGGPAGQAMGSPDRWDIGEEVVAPYLWSRRIRRLDAVMLTHAHSDHMGGLPAVLRDLRPRELWLSVQPGRSPGLLALRQEAEELGVAVRWFRAGDSFAWGGARAEVLAPETAYSNSGAAANDDSLVMRLAYGRASVLLEGDAQAAAEAAMLAHGRVRASTLLKVGHHGSKTSTTPEFLHAVAPREAVISVGRHNTFGHPRLEVLQRLQDAGVRTVRTDRAGLETFLLTADGGITAEAGSLP